MSIELVIPSVGESIKEVEIGRWLKAVGDAVAADKPVVELETDKATVELPAPQAGVIEKLLKKPGDKAAVGEAIALLGPAGQAAATAPAKPAEKKIEQTPPAAPAKKVAKAEPAAPIKSPSPSGRGQGEGETRGQGLGARGQNSGAPSPAPPPSPAPSVPATPAPPPPAGARGEEEIVPMTPIRRRIAERLVAAQHAAALATTYNEIDMSAVQATRHEYQEAFGARFGVKLGLMSFFVKATIEALKLVPQLNSEIRGTDIVYRNYFDIGIAVAGGKGLVVPVLRNAERISFAQVETAIADFAARAKDNKLRLDELAGGTFTITNGGVFGSLFSVPIINPPQSGVLGMHAITDRPVASGGQVVIRPMMYVALTYDHRIVDGREAVGFLRQIKDVLENPARMLIEV